MCSLKHEAIYRKTNPHGQKGEWMHKFTNYKRNTN